MIRLPWRGILQSRPVKPPTGGSPSEAQPSNPDTASSGDLGAPQAGAVRGERAPFLVSGALSLQSRMSSLLAAGLMIMVGTGMLAWYYVQALSRPAAHSPAHASLLETAGEGMTLPPFGVANPLRGERPAGSVARMPQVRAITALQSSPSGLSPLAVPKGPGPLLEPPLDRAPGGIPRGYGTPSRLSSRQQELDRRLSGEVFAATTTGTIPGAPTSATGGGVIEALPLASLQAQVPMSANGPPGDALQTLLRPSVLSATRAQILPARRLLLSKGTFIDCTLETAIDSTLPGMTTCVTAGDTFGADGSVVLLERGTKLIGETRGAVHQGDTRVFVVWTEARTSSGVVVQLDSPGTDALGRSGLEGAVNRHFWQRFGAAALVSAIDGAVQSEVQSSSRGGTVVVDPTASEDVLTEVLRGSVNIPPTIRVLNGARIQVLVARDVDFRPVYELEPQ